MVGDRPRHDDDAFGRQWGINFRIVGDTEVIQMAIVRISTEKFYKGGSQEKTHVLRPEFFLLPSPCDRARSVLNGRAMDSGARHCDPAVWIFSTSGFHRLFATKPVSSETSKAERWSGANHGSI